MSARTWLVSSKRGWTPPDGLERARPREVRLTRGGKALVALAAALWVGALASGIGLYLLSSRQAAEQRQFQEQAADGIGEVTRLWRSRGESTQRWVAYRLSVNGLTYEDQAKLGRRAWGALRVGDQIPLRHLPSDPSVSQLRGREPEPMPAFVASLTAGALALTAGCVLLPLRTQRRLLALGRPAPARVTRHAKDQHGTSFDFEFGVLSGAKVKGKGGPRSKPPAIGATICIVYEPDNPRRSAPYPFSLVVPADRRSL